MTDLIYDIESYPNVFTLTVKNADTCKVKTFECSPWRNDFVALKNFIKKAKRHRMVGFNNFFYDYPVLHYILTNCLNDMNGEDIAKVAKHKTDSIIGNFNARWNHVIWDKEMMVPQVDLFRIHHFDNVAKSTSLKVLEFNMRSHSIQDLPYPPDQALTDEQTRKLIIYNIHDVEQTYDFYLKSLDLIRFREELTAKYGRNFMNHNDTKIGKDYFIMELEKAGVTCFDYDEVEGRYPMQTKRSSIWLSDVIFPYVKFKRPEFKAILDWLKRQKIRETKGVFTRIDPDTLGDLEQYMNLKKEVGKIKNLNCIADGFQFDFGTGGIHGSVASTIVSSDDEYVIMDYDVTSYYPSIAIENDVYPEHLGEKFCEIYGDMKEQRISYPKGTAENAMLKLALNGVYGDSNNKFSPFFDPQYTMTITINGQLMLCMLAERLMEIDSLEMIQINTDGLTVRVKRSDLCLVDDINSYWQQETRLELEEAEYSRMFIRDVNNYIAEYSDGKLKRKGAFEYERQWHQNQSSMVVPKAVEACLVHGKDVREFVADHDDEFDFMLRTKVPRTSRLMLENDDAVQLQNTTRYYVSTDGGKLVKIMPPLAKKPDVERRIGINKEWVVTPMNEMGEVDNIDYNFYVDEALKLITPMTMGMLEKINE